MRNRLQRRIQRCCMPRAFSRRLAAASPLPPLLPCRYDASTSRRQRPNKRMRQVEVSSLPRCSPRGMRHEERRAALRSAGNHGSACKARGGTIRQARRLSTAAPAARVRRAVQRMHAMRARCERRHILHRTNPTARCGGGNGEPLDTAILVAGHLHMRPPQHLWK